MELPLEYCFKCNDPTGRAGRGEDSLYDDEDNGPYCRPCFDRANPPDSTPRHTYKESKMQANVCMCGAIKDSSVHIVEDSVPQDAVKTACVILKRAKEGRIGLPPWDEAVTLAQAVLKMHTELKGLRLLKDVNEGLSTSHYEEVTALRTALEAVDSQAVCLGMDGDEGNAKMLLHIHELADSALVATPPADKSHYNEVIGQGWQPIESVLKDGTPIDLWANGRRVVEAEWGLGHNSRKFEQPCWFVSNDYDGWCEPVVNVTHWMLPPEAPEESPQDG